MKKKQRSQKDRLIPLLKEQWVSAKDSWDRIGLYALSQRVGDLIGEGHPIEKRWKEENGSRFMTYRMGK
jgi:hypothetical protein